MSTLHVFDLDGTLYNTFAANKAAYEAAGLPEYKQEYYWQTAAAWDCPPAIHERKGMLMPSYSNLISSAWAMPFFEVAERAGVAVVLTGASSNSVRFMEKIHGRAFPTPFGITHDEEGKRRVLTNLSGVGWNIVYYDDNVEMGTRLTMQTPLRDGGDIKLVTPGDMR